MTYVGFALVHMMRFSSVLVAVVPRRSGHARAGRTTHEAVVPKQVARLSLAEGYGVTSVQNRASALLSLYSFLLLFCPCGDSIGDL
jgi:hypothetical protein